MNFGFGMKFKQIDIQINWCFDKRYQSGQHLQVTFYIFSNQICIWNPRNWLEYCVLTVWIKKTHLHLCFDRENPAYWLEFWFWLKINIKWFEIWILKKKNLENKFEFAFWQIKSNKLIWIFVLTGKIQKINLIFDMKIWTN